MNKHPDPEEFLRVGARAWPGVTLEPGTFAQWLLRVPERASAPVERAPDLFLACACAHGDPAALEAFEQRYAPDLAAVLRRSALPRAEVDDVLQSLRDYVLVGRIGAEPKIGSYTGRGELGGWLRVTAMRMAMRRKKGEHHVAVGLRLEQAFEASGTSPELSYMKEVYRAAFERAFRAALKALPEAQKLVLKQHLLDGLSIDDIGRLNGVHRATAARWIVRARTALLDETRARFVTEARISPAECESVLRLVKSRLDVTLRTMFG